MLESEQKKSLAESICECIEQSINRNYGTNVAEVVFGLFGKRYGLKRTDVVTHPAKFEEILGSMFGTGTACLLVKRTVIRELDRRFQIRIGEVKTEDRSMSITSAVKRILQYTS